MTNKRMKLTLAALIALCAVPHAPAQDITVDWHTVDGGGEMFTTGGDFELSGTIGQPDASELVMTGGDFELTGGFWPGVEKFCFGDLNADDAVNLSDLAQLLGSYGTTSGATYEDGDLDGDGDVDLSDLAALLGIYGTACE